LNEHDIARLGQIEAINNHSGILWKAGPNERFHGRPIGASKILCGSLPTFKPSLANAVKKGTARLIGADPKVDIPADFDAAANWPNCAKVIGDIRDQSSCGCCWAVAAASAASDRLCIFSNGTVQVPLSANDLCFCEESDGCGGGNANYAWDFIKKSGLVTGGQNGGLGPFGDGYCSQYPLAHNKPLGPGCPPIEPGHSPACPTECDGSAKAPHDNFETDAYNFGGDVATYTDVKSVQQAIMKAGPVETSFDVYDDFENYKSGIYHRVSSKMVGGHAVRIVGWGVDKGVDYWKIANSWNPYWGESGYFRIIRGTNECGIEDSVVSNDGFAGWGGGGLGPAPAPSPGPPHSEACFINQNQRDCISCTDPESGSTCHWCVDDIGIGMCQESAC